MMLIRCPWCGPRDEVEFRYGGEADIAYPVDVDSMPDEAWAEFLFMRDNSKGQLSERWVHSAGCRRWFGAVRDTVTHEIVSTAPPATP